MKKIAFIFILAAFSFFSCERKSDKKSGNVGEPKTETAKKDIDLIVDSVNTAWTTLISTEEQKFQDLKRLLDEISYTSSYDPIAHDSLTKKLEIVKAKRYDQSLDTSAIDAYNNATDRVVFEVLQLKRTTKGIEQHPLADELENDILAANSPEKVAQLLGRYNWWTNQYNNYLKKNKKKLEKLGEPYASYKEKAVLFPVN